MTFALLAGGWRAKTTVCFGAVPSVPSTRLVLPRRRDIGDVAAVASISPHFRSSHHVAVHWSRYGTNGTNGAGSLMSVVRGRREAEMPFRQPTNFRLSINTKA